MTEAELKALIREAIMEMLTPTPRRALVLFTGGLLGFEEATASLRLLADCGVQLDYLQTPSAKRVLDQSAIAALGMQEVSSRLVAEHQLLIAPTLTANIAAKVSHGISDCLASNLFSEFIMANKAVIASRTPVCPDGTAKQSWFPTMPPAYADLLRANLTTLARFGVRLTESHALCRTAIAAFERAESARRTELAATLGSSVEAIRTHETKVVPTPTAPPTADGAKPSAVNRPQQLISQQVIQQLPNGTELRIAAGAKVTALAQDLASTRSIRITREV